MKNNNRKKIESVVMLLIGYGLVISGFVLSKTLELDLVKAMMVALFIITIIILMDL